MAETETTEPQENTAENASAPEQQAPPQAQETTVIHSPAKESSQSNANLFMILVLFVILLIGVALAITLRGRTDSEAEKKEKLKAQIAALTSGDDTLLTKGGGLDARITRIINDANQIRTDYDTMRAGYMTAKQQLKALQGEQSGNVNTITRLSTTNAKLQEEISQLKTLAATAKSYQQQVALLNQNNKDLETEIAKLRSGPSNESVKTMQAELNKERQTIISLEEEITQLKRKMTGMVDNAKLKELNELKIQNDKLRSELAALRVKVDFSKLFVKSHTKLPVHVQALYQELQTLDGKTPDELALAYTRIASHLKAENIQRVKFKEGSYLLNFKEQSTLQNNLTTTLPTDYFLVVGYASKVGDEDSNQTLSANRATAVASVVNQLKKEGQEVRAVYLGQTDRFSKTKKEANQLCEVWKISL